MTPLQLSEYHATGRVSTGKQDTTGRTGSAVPGKEDATGLARSGYPGKQDTNTTWQQGGFKTTHTLHSNTIYNLDTDLVF